MEFGSQIRNKRQELGLSQGQVANHLYVSRKSVSRWETGNSFPDISTLIKLSNYFQISLDPLIKEDTNMEENLKKREVNKSISLPYYLSSFLSLIIFMVSLAGISFSHSFMMTNFFFGIAVLALLDSAVMVPIYHLKEKRHLKTKQEVGLVDSGILWLIIGIVSLLISVPVGLLVKFELGGAFFGGGVVGTILGIQGLINRKKKVKKENSK